MKALVSLSNVPIAAKAAALVIFDLCLLAFAPLAGAIVTGLALLIFAPEIARFCDHVIDMARSRAAVAVACGAIALAFLVFGDAAFAADAPLIAAPAGLPEWLVPLWNSVVTAAAIAGVLTHVRALIPNDGVWAIVGKALDWFVGNYLNAKNA